MHKETKSIKCTERIANIAKIISGFKGLKKISGSKSYKRKDAITDMSGKEGQKETARQGIADIFGDLYETLCADTRTQPAGNVQNHRVTPERSC